MNNRTKGCTLATICLTAASLCGGVAAAAQESAPTKIDEEVVVTARQRAESLQDVPVAVSAFTEVAIEDAGIERTGDFLQLTPNVTFASSESAGVNFLTIRGVSQVRNGDSPVAVVIDGVSITDPGQFDQELFDIQQIEVLKGPQGALYGRNAIGGAINIITKPPSDEFTGKIKLGAGNGDRMKVQTALSGPLSDSASFRLAGSFVDHNGYINNTFTNERVDPYRDETLRGRLNWDPSDVLSIDLRAGYSKTQGGALNFVATAESADDTSVPIRASRRGNNERELQNISAKIDLDMSFATLTSITAWNSQDEYYAADAFPFDCAPFCDNGNDNPRFVKVFNDLKTLSQEIRFTSPGDSRFRWIAGAYYLSTEKFRGLPTERDIGQSPNRDVFTDLTVTAFADDNDNTATALFSQFNYDLSDEFELSFALRYDRDEREQTDVAPEEFSTTTGKVRREVFSELQPKLTLRYQPHDDLNLFATLSKGFRSGGFNQNGVSERALELNINGIGDSYRKEVSENIEVGFKTSLADGRVKLNGGLFHTNIKDQHFFQFIGALNAQLINNIDDVVLQGAELDVHFEAADGLDLYVAAGLTDSEIKEYIANPEFTGNWAPYVARTTFNAGAQYTAPLGDNLQGLARLDYERRGKQFWDTANSSARSPVNLVNLRLGVESETDDWSVTAWAKNLTNTRYNAEFVIGGTAQIAPPRTFGIDFVKRF